MRQEGDDGTTTSIFIVDDEVFLVDLYRDILSFDGYKIVGVAYDGSEAVDKFSRADPKPDIIVMDQRMPVMSGLDAMKEIRRIRPEQKVLIASADAGIEEIALGFGASGFLLKPFNLDSLRIILAKLASEAKAC